METSSTTTQIPGIRRRGNIQLVSERTAPEAPTLPANVLAALAAREAALARKEASLTAALATVAAAYAILGSRALVLFTAAGAAVAFGWAVYSHEAWSLAAASMYAGLVFLPALYLDHTR